MYVYIYIYVCVCMTCLTNHIIWISPEIDVTVVFGNWQAVFGHWEL
jgi:hypothetical protein